MCVSRRNTWNYNYNWNYNLMCGFSQFYHTLNLSKAAGLAFQSGIGGEELESENTPLKKKQA